MKKRKFYLVLGELAKRFQQKRLMFIGLLMGLLSTPAFAQIDQVNRALSGQLSNTMKLGGTIINYVKILSGILAVVALISLVVKFQEGDHEAKKKLTFWIFGLVILFIALTIIQELFGLSGTGI